VLASIGKVPRQAGRNRGGGTGMKREKTVRYKVQPPSMLLESDTHPANCLQPSSCLHAACSTHKHDVKRFRGGLVLKAHRLLYHSTLGLRDTTPSPPQAGTKGYVTFPGPHLYAIGGRAGRDDLRMVHRLDVTTDVWSTSVPLSDARAALQVKSTSNKISIFEKYYRWSILVLVLYGTSMVTLP